VTVQSSASAIPEYLTRCRLRGGTGAASRAIKASGSSSTEVVPTEHWVTNEGGEHEVDAVKCDGRHGTWETTRSNGAWTLGILIAPQAGVL
jgi:hypothetical protein